MSVESTRTFLLSLHRAEETLQWDALVFWVLDKAVGGRMFAVLQIEPDEPNVLAFPVPPESYNELLEIDGVQPAPYLARAHWIAVERWDVFPPRDLQNHLRRAYERVEAKLPRRTQRVLELGTREYRSLVREQRANGKAKRPAARQPAATP